MGIRYLCKKSVKEVKVDFIWSKLIFGKVPKRLRVSLRVHFYVAKHLHNFTFILFVLILQKDKKEKIILLRVLFLKTMEDI